MKASDVAAIVLGFTLLGAAVDFSAQTLSHKTAALTVGPTSHRCRASASGAPVQWGSRMTFACTDS